MRHTEITAGDNSDKVIEDREKVRTKGYNDTENRDNCERDSVREREREREREGTRYDPRVSLSVISFSYCVLALSVISIF